MVKVEKISVEEYREIMSQKPGASKFGARKMIVDGIRFDSEAEAFRYSDLKLLERSGAIRDLQLQPRFELDVGEPGNGRMNCGFYKGDFQYFDTATGQTVVEDVKGADTPISKLKRKLVLAIYRICVKSVDKHGNEKPGASIKWKEPKCPISNT